MNFHSKTGTNRWRTWHNVRLVSDFVEFLRASLHVHSKVPAKVGWISWMHACTSCATHGCRYGRKGCYNAILQLPFMNFFRFFHASRWTSQGGMSNFRIFGQSVLFLWISIKKPAQTDGGRDATCVWSPISLKFCVASLHVHSQVPAKVGWI